MALTKEVVKDRIEILEDGRMQIREATVIKENGVEISRTFHRKVIDVEDDVTSEDKRIKDVANAVWTAEVKNKRRVEKAKHTEE